MKVIPKSDSNSNNPNFLTNITVRFTDFPILTGVIKIKLKYKIWLEKEGQVLFGHGREALLKAIEECESLNAAAKKLNMSYRAAWGRLKASEERMGCKLVERQRGKRMHLTP